MENYCPNDEIRSSEWLALDEGERHSLVQIWHRDAGEEPERLSAHSAIHVIVENQLAEGDERVLQTLARLRREGLDRHEAIHAIGSVLAAYLYTLAKEQTPRTDGHRQYFARLKKLSAKRWLKGRI